MTTLTWRQQAEAAFRSALDGVRRATGPMAAGHMTALGCALTVAEQLIREDERKVHEHQWTRCAQCKQPGQPCACAGGPCCEWESREEQAYAEGTADERQRIRQLAAERKATYLVCDSSGVIIDHPPFADLIGGEQQ